MTGKKSKRPAKDFKIMIILSRIAVIVVPATMLLFLAMITGLTSFEVNYIVKKYIYEICITNIFLAAIFAYRWGVDSDLPY